MAFAWKLLTLVAVLLMPFGMTASAAAAPHHSAAMPIQHCPEQGSKQAGKAGFAQCTMACSAAFPALPAKQDRPLLILCEPVSEAAIHQLRGLHPETATPPPKRS